MQDASEVVNAVLGACCVYKRFGGDTVKNIHIVIDKNQAIKNEFGVLAGYRVEASILKAEIAKIKTGDVFIDETPETWRVNQLMRETEGKWYVDVVKIG
jgi:hypothetical protein